MRTDFRLKILIALAAVLILGGIVSIIIISASGKNGANLGTPKMKIDFQNFDFGTVSMANGLVKHNFKIINEGEGGLKLSDINTSCMCTTAVLEINGKRSPEFGMPGHGPSYAFWSERLEPGQAANLEVTFNPNAHGPEATGPITRAINLFSNDNGKEGTKTTFLITAEVVH